ncbi:hypothetical protein MUK42_16375 [Musa troglodytarum]|uniref:Uncharacterized protein n=1 Tax=Musa troglodytarum TaxID=320322 RepID=A0A9E7HAR9_9LILI|nr:hypothetical protein MUK42_16375 [Musa troglodytarum]
MRAVVAVVASRSAFATAAVSSFHRLKPIVRCSSSSPSTAVSTTIPTSTSFDHICFIKDIAATRPPEHLNYLLNMLQSRGEAVISPAAKEGLVPLVIPLSESSAGTLTCLLRWPTSPPGMEMPVVGVHKHGVWLLAKSVDQYIHRILVEEDAKAQDSNKLWNASSEAGEKLYKRGDFLESQIADLDVYLLKKVSAMITGEFYTKNHFPGFGRPFAFNAQLLLKFVALDEAAFWLDLASIDGTWDEVVDRVAECYMEAGLCDIAKFILYRE